MRSASSLARAPSSLRIVPKPCCVDITGWHGDRQARPAPATVAAPMAPRRLRDERHLVEEALRARLADVDRPSNRSHSWPGRMLIAPRNVSICAGVIRPAWLSLWPAKRQAEALDRVGDEADRPVVVDACSKASSSDGRSWPPRLVISRASSSSRAALDQPRRPDPDRRSRRGAACARPRRPGRSAPNRAGSGSRRSSRAAARRPARRTPASSSAPYFRMTTSQPKLRNIASKRAHRPFADHRVEALAVVVDDPPGVAEAVLPAFEQRLEDVALVHLGVADQRDHAALRPLRRPALGAHIVLHQRGEQRLRHAEADRAGREIDVVDVLGARGIALRALVAAEVLELLAGVWLPSRYWMAWKTGLACGLTATRSSGRSTAK